MIMKLFMKIFKGFNRKIIDFILPYRCPVCEKILLLEKPEFWCKTCWEKVIPWIKAPFCSKCGTPIPSMPSSIKDPKPDLLCDECLSEPLHFDIIRSSCLYDGIVEKLIRGLKYGKKLHYVLPLGEILNEAFSTRLKEEKIDIMIPVPLHVERLKERGFNQSLLLAKELNKTTGIPYSYSILSKVKNTAPQVSLHKSERKKNLRKAFAVSESARTSLLGRSVLIVDDVITTGTTILECAKALKKAGASRVIGLSVARTTL